MSIWVRDDGTITDEGDPTAFEYVPASQHNKLREALSVMLEDYADACDEWDHEIQEYGHKVIEQARDALKITEE